MKFLISQGRVKRKIVGDFRFCASRVDFMHLIEQITAELAIHGNFSYGWIKIRSPFLVPFASEGPPEPWGKEEP